MEIRLPKMKLIVIFDSKKQIKHGWPCWAISGVYVQSTEWELGQVSMSTFQISKKEVG
jgi:hypothetical protein